MLKLIDNHSNTTHEMSENQVRNFVKEELNIEDSFDLDIKEISEILLSHDYTLERV